MEPEAFERAKKIQSEIGVFNKCLSQWDDYFGDSFRVSSEMDKINIVSGVLYVPDIGAVKELAKKQISDKIEELEKQFKAL